MIIKSIFHIEILIFHQRTRTLTSRGENSQCEKFLFFSFFSFKNSVKSTVHYNCGTKLYFQLVSPKILSVSKLKIFVHISTKYTLAANSEYYKVLLQWIIYSHLYILRSLKIPIQDLAFLAVILILLHSRIGLVNKREAWNSILIPIPKAKICSESYPKILSIFPILKNKIREIDFTWLDYSAKH